MSKSPKKQGEDERVPGAAEDKNEARSSAPAEKDQPTATTEEEETRASKSGTEQVEADPTPTQEPQKDDAKEEHAKKPLLGQTMPGMRQSVNDFANNKEQATFDIPAQVLPQLERKCFKCGKEESEETFLYRCKGCNKRLYCGRDCQTTDWTDSHMKQCATLKADASIPEVEQKKRKKTPKKAAAPKPKAEEEKEAAAVVAIPSSQSVQSVSTQGDASDSEAGERVVLSASQKDMRVQRMNTMTTKNLDQMKLLQTGQVFMKHGRSGKPHQKNVFLGDAGLLYWCKPGKKKEDSSKCFDLVECEDVRVGKTTSVFRRSTAKEVKPSLCFSVIAKTRTLDLVAATEAERDMWAGALTYTMNKLRAESK